MNESNDNFDSSSPLSLGTSGLLAPGSVGLGTKAFENKDKEGLCGELDNAITWIDSDYD